MTPLQRARRLLGVTVADLAAAAGVSIAATQKHLSGRVQPGVYTALAYAAYLQRRNRSPRLCRAEELLPTALFPEERRCPAADVTPK